MLIKINFRGNPPLGQKSESRVPHSCRTGFQQYTVVRGDTMSGIAKRFNVSLEFLTAENPHITDPNIIFPGDVICVPAPVPQPGEGRVPESCPQAYNQYTVKTGDTMNKIAQNIGVPVDLLIANNPHITDPGLIFPGDVLCVPVPLILPCCTVLHPTGKYATPDAVGSAVVQRDSTGEQVIGMIGINLPTPSSLGDFDMYEGFVGIAGIGGFGFGLYPTAEQTVAWAGTLKLKPLLSAGNQLYVIPGNSQTGISGQPVLTENLSQCSPGASPA